MTLASVVSFLKRFFLGLGAVILLIVVNLISLLLFGSILRAAVATVIWIFIIYCIGHTLADLIGLGE